MAIQPGQTTGAASELMEMVRMKFLVFRLIHFALLLGTLMFGAVVFLLSYKQTMVKTLDNPIILIAMVMCVAVVAGSYVLRKVVRATGPAPTDAASALAKYQVVCLVQWAVLEGGGMFSAVAVLITKNLYAFFPYVICVAFLAFRRPSEREFLSMFAPRRQ